MTSLSMIGVPSSAGSYAAGQDQAPRALRAAGLAAALVAAGVDVHDAGDLSRQVWSPDREHPRSQNADEVVTSVRELADRVPSVLDGGRRLLVVGGNCTIALGVMAAMGQVHGPGCGLVYVDRHFDLNTPTSTNEGAFDWMGLGHALDLPGADDRLAAAFEVRPLLQLGQLVMLGGDLTQATDFEREHVARLGLPVIGQERVVADPETSAAEALDALPAAPFAVHVDVDVLDFVDAPLAENTSGRNVGPTLDQLRLLLRVLVRDDRWTRSRSGRSTRRAARASRRRCPASWRSSSTCSGRAPTAPVVRVAA